MVFSGGGHVRSVSVPVEPVSAVRLDAERLRSSRGRPAPDLDEQQLLSFAIARKL
jgi:hypothetical protein